MFTQPKHLFINFYLPLKRRSSKQINEKFFSLNKLHGSQLITFYARFYIFFKQTSWQAITFLRTI